MYIDVFPMRFSWNARSVHSIPIPSGKTSAAIFSISTIASPVLCPGARAPIISAHGYRLKRETLAGPTVLFTFATDPKGTFAPCMLGILRFKISPKLAALGTFSLGLYPVDAV